MTHSDRSSLYINAMRGLSHELRNALTAVSGFSDLLQARTCDDTDRFMLKQVQDAALRIHTMLDSVARFAIRPGQIPALLSIHQSVRDAWELAVWQHRGNMATAQFSLETEQQIIIDIMGCHELLLSLFGHVLVLALHTEPVLISLVDDDNGDQCLSVSWTSEGETQDLSAVLGMSTVLGCQTSVSQGCVRIVFCKGVLE